MANALQFAQNMIGTREGQAALTDFMATGGQNLDPVTTAWCAAFVNAALGHAGLPGTGSNMARSFLDYGTPVSQPQAGDIAVLSRGAAPYGHVGFYQGMTPEGQVQLLGGNQGDRVSTASYDPSRVLGYRRPTAQGGEAAPGSVGQWTQATNQPMPFTPPQPSNFAATTMQNAIFGGDEDWLQNKSYSSNALAADFLGGRNPLRRFIYQKLFG